MTAICEKFLQGERMRVTRLTDCGAPEGGACGLAVSDGFVQVQLTPNVEAGERYLQRNAAGRPLVNQRGKPILNWFDYSAQFVEVDPELFTLITGMPVILDDTSPTPQAVGFGVDEDTFATGNFALEAWLNLAEGAECVDDPCYGYSLLPWAVEGALADNILIGNQVITFTINGRTRKGTQWGVGPYDVLLDANGDPSPLLTSTPSRRHYHQQIVCLAPPEAACGCQPLVIGS